jgi:hypothetical protein
VLPLQRRRRTLQLPQHGRGAAAAAAFLRSRR